MAKRTNRNVTAGRTVDVARTGSAPNANAIDPRDPFANVGLAIAQRFIAANTPPNLELDVNRKFYEGDHWADGAGWIGPVPQVDEEGYSETLKEIARVFTTKNVVREVVRRQMTGVVGEEPMWSWAPTRPMQDDEEPTPEEKTAGDELDDAVRRWWDKRKMNELLQNSVSKLGWAGRSGFRFYIPDTFGAQDPEDTGRVTLPRPTTIADALDQIWLESTEPETSTVYEHPTTKRWLGIHLYRHVDQNGIATGGFIVELSYLDPERKQTLMVTLDSNSGAARSAIAHDLGGRLHIYEMQDAPLITPQVIDQQKALNLAETCIPRTVTTSGFLEMILLNAQLPGQFLVDPATGHKKFIPEPLNRGPGAINALQGIVTKDKDQNQILATPSVSWRDPVDPKPVITARDAHYAEILDECDQVHVLTNADARPSGRSREQARADYEKRLKTTKQRVDGAGRWILETAVAIGEILMGAPGKYTSLLRANFQAEIDVGPPTQNEMKDIRDAYKDGVVSLETAMVVNGVVDVEGELAKIAEQQSAQLDLRKRQAEVVQLLVDAGAGFVAACEFLGIDPADAQKLIDGSAFWETPEDPDVPTGTPTHPLPSAGAQQATADAAKAAADAKAKGPVGPNGKPAPGGSGAPVAGSTAGKKKKSGSGAPRASNASNGQKGSAARRARTPSTPRRTAPTGA